MSRDPTAIHTAKAAVDHHLVSITRRDDSVSV